MGIAAVGLLMLLSYVPFRDLIPADDGFGYDGVRYARWAKHVPVTLFPEGPRPPYVKSGLDSYGARRFLPSTVIHYAMGAAGVPRTNANVIAAFTAANLILLTLSLYWWCRASDASGLALRGKWVGFVALLVSYANWKMPFFYPVLTDSFALALGALSALFYFERRYLALAVVTVAGAFVWPTIPYFGFLLLAFPRACVQPIAPERRRPLLRGGAHTWLAAIAALLALTLIAVLVATGYEIPPTPVKPQTSLVVLSASITALYLFFGLRLLLDSPELWQTLGSFKSWPWRRLCVSMLLVGATELAVAAIGTREAHYSGGRFVAETLVSSITQPGIFWLAHVLYFGPILILLPFLWRRMSGSIQREGVGLTLCFALALVIGAGSESRKLLNFYPFVVLFLAEAFHGIVRGWRPVAVLAMLSFVVSKVWLPMDHDLSLPWGGTIGWRALYVSSRGPWIDHTWYLLQVVPVLLITLLLFRWLRPVPGGTATGPSGLRAAGSAG